MSEQNNSNTTKGMLIQHVQQISELLRGRNRTKKLVTLAVAALVLTGFVTVRYHNEGSIISTSASSSGKELPIYCVQTDEPKIALTFDAAWGNEDTKQIMEILKKHDVKVTFFMTGGWVDR